VTPAQWRSLALAIEHTGCLRATWHMADVLRGQDLPPDHPLWDIAHHLEGRAHLHSARTYMQSGTYTYCRHCWRDRG
jgi:hypothetical protein